MASERPGTTDMAAKKMAIIATKGALDMAYPPLILASTAAALGWEVQIFFTFYGLQLLRKDLSGIAISPIGNPAMPMPVPMPVIVQMLPVSLNGFGVREATFTYYFSRIGLPIESALVVSFAGAGLIILFSLSGAVAYLLRGPQRAESRDFGPTISNAGR